MSCEKDFPNWNTFQTNGHNGVSSEIDPRICEILSSPAIEKLLMTEGKDMYATSLKTLGLPDEDVERSLETFGTGPLEAKVASLKAAYGSKQASLRTNNGVNRRDGSGIDTVSGSGDSPK